MKRILPLMFMLPLAAFGYACSKSGDGTAGNGGDNGNPAGPGSDDGGSTTTSSGGPGNANVNPIDGIAAPTVLLDTGDYTDGPIWSVGEGVIYFTTPLGAGGLYRMREDGSTIQILTGDATTGAIPIGNSIDKAGNLVTFDAKMITRTNIASDAAAGTTVASSYPDPDAGAAGDPFDTLNDGVVRADGTMYVTDPGYFGTPIANRIYRVTAAGQVSVVEAFDDVPRPNGIALSPDQKTLYVGFTQPEQGTMPFIRKYIVNADGTLGEHANLVDVTPADSEPDGIEVDTAGNLYVATKPGVLVLKPDGTTIGTIPLPDQPTGMAFGSKDMQTLFITTQGTKIYTVHVNVPGIAQ